MNKVILIGNISTDVELKYSQSNKAVATFNLAVNREYTNTEGNKEVDFIKIVVWGKQAENINTYLRKGSKLAIEGRLQIRSYESKEGKKSHITEVVAENVQFLDSKKNDKQEENPYKDMSIKTEVQQQFEISDSDLPF